MTTVITKIMHPMGNGSTEPWLAMCKKDGENEFPAVIKLCSNVQGILTVINELVSYRLANDINILMPESGCAYFTSETEILQKEFEPEWLSQGPCFYSRYIKAYNSITPEIVNDIYNKNSIARIILFDHFVYNKDRNPGNFLISSGKGNKLLYAIDHTHVFKNGAIWRSQDFIQGIASCDYNDLEILENNDYGSLFEAQTITNTNLITEASEMQSLLSNQVIHSALSRIPQEWNPNYTELSALERYLEYRRDNLLNICDMIVHYHR